jgi:hypothetical protein
VIRAAARRRTPQAMVQEDREKGGAGDLRMNEYKRVTSKK